jgi:hypothetical protein
MAVGHIPAYLFAVLITSFFYGIAVTLFATSVNAMVRLRGSNGKLILPLAIPSTLIFIFATVNVMGIWINTHAAFVVNEKDPEAYLDLIRTPAKTIIQTGQVGAILLADALMVYRTFFLWNYNVYVIVIPCLTFVATFTSGVSFVRLEHRIDVEASVFARAVTEWTVAFLLSSFVTTVYSTGLIAYKLISAQRKLRQRGISIGGLSGRITRILVESATLYSLNHLLYAVLYEVKTQVESTPSFLEASLASITCSLIIVRSEEVTDPSHPSQTLLTSFPAVVSADPTATEKYSNHQDGKIIALRSTEVSVDVSRTVDGDV